MQGHPWIITAALCLSSMSVVADTDLFDTLKQSDSQLFNQGFNQCNIDVFKTLISDDIEFYHDQSGLTQSKQGFIYSIESGLCRQGPVAYRALRKETLQVFPLYKDGVIYAALQTGEHDFYRTQKGQKQWTSAARFTHMWRLDKGQWKLARAFSYDHGNPKR